MGAPGLVSRRRIASFLAGAIAGLATWKRPAAPGLRIRLCRAGQPAAGRRRGLALAVPTSATWSLPLLPLFSWTVRLDPLSAWFILTLALLAVAVSIYSFGYLRPMERSRNLGALGFFYNCLLLSLTLVFTAANAFFFLFAWEVMALSAYCLVTFEHEKEETRSAAVVFLIMSHAGTGLLLIAFLLLAAFAGSLDFASFHLLASKLPPAEQGAVFLLFFLGFGVKAGIVPLHIWLPEAHPVAPSNISALMSGIVIKTGIYGMARVFFDFFGPPPLWAGTVVLAVGRGLGAAGRALRADGARPEAPAGLSQHREHRHHPDGLRRGADVPQRWGIPNLAALALIAGLYHTLNHAIFKGLLFLGAGSRAAGHAHAQHGGDGRADPPHAGDGLLLSDRRGGHFRPAAAERLRQRVAHLPGAAGGLRHHAEPHAADVPHCRRAAGADRGAGGGLFREGLRHSVSGAAAQRSGGQRAGSRARRCGSAWGCWRRPASCLGSAPPGFSRSSIPSRSRPWACRISPSLLANGFALSAGTPQGGTVSTVGIALLFLALPALPHFLVGWRLRHAARRHGPAWDCGLPGLTADNEYTATAFSKPIRMIFSALYRPRREIQAEYEVSPYYPTAIRFESEIEPTFEKHFYDPLKDWIFGLVAPDARHAGRQHPRLPRLHLRHADPAAAVRGAPMIAALLRSPCCSCCCCCAGAAGQRPHQDAEGAPADAPRARHLAAVPRSLQAAPQGHGDPGHGLLDLHRDALRRLRRHRLAGLMIPDGRRRGAARACSAACWPWSTCSAWAASSWRWADSIPAVPSAAWAAAAR